MSPETNEWFNSLIGEQKHTAEKLRALILSADERIVEELKWNQPCYSINKLFCYLQKAKRHVAIGFQKGALLKDPENVLGGAGKEMRHFRIPTGTDFDSSLIQSLIQNAIEIDRNGT